MRRRSAGEATGSELEVEEVIPEVLAEEHDVEEQDDVAEGAGDHGEPMQGLMGLRILLFALSGITLLILWHNRQLTRNKAFVLCGLYGVFIAYAVLGSLGILNV